MGALLRPGADGLVEVRAFLDALAAYARESGRDVDLIACGILAKHAWSGLRRETELLLERAAASPTPVPEPQDPWLQFLDSDFARALDDDTMATERILSTEGRFLRQVPRREAPARRATVAELLGALHEAYAEAGEAAVRQRALDERRRAHAEVRARAGLIAHDDPDLDREQLLARLPAKGEVSLAALGGTASREARVSVLQAVLQLVRDGRAGIRQDDFPFGGIFVWRRSPQVPQET